MSERRKKAPKIAWRDLMKAGGVAPAAETPSAQSSAEVVPVAESPTPGSAKPSAPAPRCNRS